MLCGSLASMLYGRGYPQKRLHGRLGLVFDAFGGRPRCLIHTRPYFTVASSAAFLSVFTSSSCVQQYTLSLSPPCINAVLRYEYPILQQKFTIPCCLIVKKKRKKKTFAYFLVIDNADENTMHILQLPNVFGFSFLLKNQGHLFPALSL